MPFQPHLLFILLTILTFTTSHSFNLTGPQTKLLTWINSKGLQQNLLLTQMSGEKRTLLIQRATLPYDFQTDENCVLSESVDNAIVYEPSQQKLVRIEYTHMQGNDIMSKNMIEVTHEAEIKLTDQFTLKLSTQKPQSSLNQPQSPQSQTPNSTQTSSQQPPPPPLPLYLYNNQSLLQIDSKLYSPQPSCYMLSRMTEKLCLQQSCATLSPFQLYDMEIGPVIKEFVLVNGIIIVKDKSEKNGLVDSVVFGEIVFAGTRESIDGSLKVNEEIITLSGTTILTVKFQVSTINVPAQQNDLRRVGQSETSPHYDILIIISNPNQVFAIKTINLFKGKQIILSDRLIIKPSQLLTYDTQWNGDKVNLPAVQILNQQLEVQSRYSLNFEITDQVTEEQVLASSNQQIIPQTFIEEVSINQTHARMKLQVIIAIAAGAGAFLLTVVVIWVCRKRISKKCFSGAQQEKYKAKRPEIEKKKQQQCDRKQSGRQLNIEYEITFQKKPQNIVSLPTSSTLHRQSISTVENPQNKTQNLQCSFNKQLPVFSKHPSSIILPQSHNKSTTLQSQLSQVNQKSITQRVKSSECVSKEESLSMSSKWDESCTKKRIRRKERVVGGKEKEEEKTETI